MSGIASLSFLQWERKGNPTEAWGEIDEGGGLLSSFMVKKGLLTKAEMNVVIKLHCWPQDLDEYYHLIIGITIPSTQLSSASTQFPSQCEWAVVHASVHTCAYVWGVFGLCCVQCVIVFASLHCLLVPLWPVSMYYVTIMCTLLYFCNQ